MKSCYSMWILFMWFDLHWPVKSKYYHQTLDYQPPDFCWKTYIKNISSLLAVRKENLETFEPS